MEHRTKKSMGQNFLKSQEALRMMCSAGEVNSTDMILEIGPGKGALTEKLLEKAGCVIAIEKDRDLIEILKEKFVNEIKNKKLILIEGDILEFNLGEVVLNFKVIANIPYNITGAIFKKFLSSDTQPERMVLLVQKEVAERIVARDGKESILSLSVKVYGNPKYMMKVHKRFFSPEPKVDSAIVAITNISKNNFKTKEEETRFFNVVKAGFAHKRKVLRKNLENMPYLEVGLPNIDKIFEKLGINPKTRAEDIKVEKWLQISRDLPTNF
jgi:16S rRNA (adenine1518-N6/adenine1519-N6)-dimethyltransferase